MNNYKAIVVSLFFTICTITAFEGRAVFDEDGYKTGLTNINPDPNGEPWIVGGMQPYNEDQAAFSDNHPALELTPKTRNRVLPEEIILLDRDEFIPVFNQKGGSCAQASGVAYLYSYQWNCIRGESGTKSGARAYGFTHNFLNDGDNGKGSWYWDGWRILQKVGAPDVTTFHGEENGGLSGTRWMDGADRWHTANDNRVDSLVKIEITSMADVEKMKAWMYDLNGMDSDKKGGCLVFAANGGSAAGNSTVSSGPHAGDKLCTSLTKDNMNHAMTFAGYSDHVGDNGAFLLLNSWGTSWGTNGYVWVPYEVVVNGGLYSEEVWGVTIKKHTPKYELKVKMSHSSRNSIVITTGFNDNSSATSASTTKDYGRAFNKSGGAYPLQGSGGSGGIELALDVSEFYSDMTGGDGAFFFTVASSGGSGTVESMSLLDYTQGGEPIEFVSDDNNVSITGTITLSVAMSSEEGIEVTAPNGGEVLLQSVEKAITWSDNIAGNVKIELFKSGEALEVIAESTESDGEYLWTPDTTLIEGADYTIVITSVDDASLADTSDAEFTLKKIKISENLLNFADWYVIFDEEHSGNHESGATLDTSKLSSDAIIGADLTVGETDNDKIWPWAKLVSGATNDLEGVTAIKLSYKSDKPFFIGLDDTLLSKDGVEYVYEIPATSSFKELTISIDQFAQPNWAADVNKTADLVLKNVRALTFSPKDAYGAAARIDIENLQLYDFKGKGVAVSASKALLVKDGIALQAITSKKVTLVVPEADKYNVALYSLKGQQLHKVGAELQAGIASVPLGVTNLGTGVLLLTVEGAGRIYTQRVVLR